MTLFYLRNRQLSKIRAGLTVGLLSCLLTIAPQALALAAAPGGGFRRLSSQISEERHDVAEIRKETVRKYFPETWIWDMVALE